MDYFDVLKRAWSITWRYKALWVLGLFAGAASTGGSGGTNYSTGSEDFGRAGDAFGQWMGENVWFLLAVGILLAVIGLAFLVLSIAAHGGLVYGANEGAESRKPALGAAWGVGFRRWGRTFMIGLTTALPVLAIVALFALLLLGAGVGGALAGDQGLAAALAGACLLMLLAVALLVVVSVVMGIVFQLALRYGVLQDVTFGQAVKRGWSDLWGKQGAFMFYLVMLLPGFAYSAVTLVVALPFILGAVAMVLAEQFVAAVVIGAVMVLVMLLPGAIYGTFNSSAWTVFFRRMTGMEAHPVPAPPPAYASAAPAPPAELLPPPPPVSPGE